MKQKESKYKYSLFYGVQNGELKHIKDVKRGLNCECICPSCKKDLNAKKGIKRIHHFAHDKGCEYGVQTAIHLAAKAILQKAKKIKIPEYNVFVNTEIQKKQNVNISYAECVYKSSAEYIEFEHVILEKKLHQFIPDVVLITNAGPLIVEVAVTNFVGREKKDIIAKSKVSAIEIDLSKINSDFNEEELENYIIHNIENKKWLHKQDSIEQIENNTQKLLSKIKK